MRKLNSKPKSMRIQRILLRSFFLLLFLATVPIVGLSFYASWRALEAEIERNIKNDATMLMGQIDMLMFEHLQNLHSWSHLDVLQEGRIGDLDKRLAQFLTELEYGYPGVYLSLFYLNKNNTIVARSSKSSIKDVFYPNPDWITVQVPHGEVVLEPLNFQAPYQQASLFIRAPVQDKYTTEDMGQLYGVFDFWQLFHLFDEVSHAESGDRFVILLDAQGRTIAASDAVRAKQLLLSNTFVNWKPTDSEHITKRIGQPLTDSLVLVGYAQSKGYQGYVNMGWSLLVVQSAAQAFKPILALWWLFCATFIVTALIAGGVAHWVSGRIAKPLLDLTLWVQQFQKNADVMRPKVSGVQEVSELSTAFGGLVDDLEHSRQQVVRAAKLAVVGEMAAIMAHEVRTPLGILQTTAQMLQWETALSAEGKEMTQMIVAESARLNRLITTLLDCARPRQPTMHIHDVHKIIQRVLDLLAAQAQKKAITIGCHSCNQAVFIECDQELLVQVFLNLILNAIQILPVGGKIQVVTDWSNSSIITIKIADNGPGITPENRALLFDPFFSNREGGIGLGLTVTQQIVDIHGGRLWAEDCELGGACFILVLPVNQEQTLC